MLIPLLPCSNDSNPKVIRSVERILSIWEERSIYTGVLISELRGYLKEEVKEESPPDTPAENKSTPSLVLLCRPSDCPSTPTVFLMGK